MKIVHFIVAILLHLAMSDCSVRINSKGWYDVGTTFVQVFINSVQLTLPISNGLNLIQLNLDCTVTFLLGANFYTDQSGSSTAVINTIHNIPVGAVILVGVQDTGPSYTSSSNSALYAALSSVGSTATSFPFRASYVLIGAKATTLGIPLCQRLPQSAFLSCAYNLTLTLPSTSPTSQPTSRPSIPTSQPSSQPSIPTSQPSRLPSNQPSRQPTRKPSVQPSGQPTRNPTSQPSRKPSNQPTMQPSRQPTVQPISGPTCQPTSQPSARPSCQPASRPTRIPSAQPSSKPSIPTSQPTSRPSIPTSQPTSQPSRKPSRQPVSNPTSNPSGQPSEKPSSQPSSQPSRQPTTQPSRQPSGQPGQQPTSQPSRQPTSQPSSQPVGAPSCKPTTQPTCNPSAPTSQPSSMPTNPTGTPTTQPSQVPSCQPISKPTSQPSHEPTRQPSSQPISRPTRQPFGSPSSCPSSQPTTSPTCPSAQPSAGPSSQPSRIPSCQPTCHPTNQPTRQPTMQPFPLPSRQPTSKPTGKPSSQPSSQPSRQPMAYPSSQPSGQPTKQPTSQPTRQPTNQPTTHPSNKPTARPSIQPSSVPSRQPSSQPNSRPSTDPTVQPTCRPSAQPFSHPTAQPTVQPSVMPSCQPFAKPSSSPSSQPASQPTEFPTVRPVSHPSSEPSNPPSTQPSRQPISQPTSQPNSIPSSQPTSHPTTNPTLGSSTKPSTQPTAEPSVFPSCTPTGTPTSQPTSFPSCLPTNVPSPFPSSQPSNQPTVCPTSIPTSFPTSQPFSFPSSQPSTVPSSQPTIQSTSSPSGQPTAAPSNQPSNYPTSLPSSLPSSQPTSQPSNFPTWQPYGFPSNQPTCEPSNKPTLQPTCFPTFQPSSAPTYQPTSFPSSQPTGFPSFRPTSFPSYQPSSSPSLIPTSTPSIQPSSYPSSHPSFQPSTQPSVLPSEIPTSQPSSLPSNCPSSQPTAFPSENPVALPTTFPSCAPTNQPTCLPSHQPTAQPSVLPSGLPTVRPSRQPSSGPSASPSSQPSKKPSNFPSSLPSMKPSSRPTDSPSQQPFSWPSAVPSSQPFAAPTSIPSDQPSRLPTSQPSSWPSTQPTSQPTKNRLHCIVANSTFYSSIRDDCVKCPVHSFLNHSGEETCFCNAGYSQTGYGLTLNCTKCTTGEVSSPGNGNCTQCLSGFFANIASQTCDLCPISFYSTSPGQIRCYSCPAGTVTATLGSTSVEQCISPVPNFTLGFLSLFIVVAICSWYIVFGKFQRVSFERRVSTVMPNIDKCRKALIREEEFHYQHLIFIQEKKSYKKREFKFLRFALLSVILVIISIWMGFIFFTYQVFFTSLILWRGLNVNFKLKPIFELLLSGLKDITEYIGLPVNLIYFAALPFLYVSKLLTSFNLNLSSVNVTCAGSQAPIELLINCFILGLLIIIIRSDYQLVFSILLNNVNQRFLLNNLEEHIDAGKFGFSRYFYICLAITALNVINPFQVALRYCMGFIEIGSFAQNHRVAHKVSETCNQVPSAPYFDSFLGYASSIFAWWLILPAVYCLAEVVVPKCKIHPPKKLENAKVHPARTISENAKNACGNHNDIESEDHNDEYSPEKAELVVPPELPNHLSLKFPGFDEEILAHIYQEGYKDRQLELERNQHLTLFSTVDVARSPNYFRRMVQKLPFVLTVHNYCKDKYFLMISVDRWISNLFSAWINILQSKAFKEDRTQQLMFLNGEKQPYNSQISRNKAVPVEKIARKQVFPLSFGGFVEEMRLYNMEQMKKQSEIESLWKRERHRNRHCLPSYYELSLVVRDELHESILEPFSSILALLGLGHFFTLTGRHYWCVVFNNYKLFLSVCFGVWTDESVEAYALEETCSRLSIDEKGSQKDSEEEKYETRFSIRKFSVQLLGFNLTQAGNSENTGEMTAHRKDTVNRSNTKGDKENFREVLPSVISVLICSRVILFQIVPALVLFTTISMTLASFPLFIFNKFLAETLPPLIIWGEINSQMAVDRELISFIALDPQTKEVLSKKETIRVLCEEYSWRLYLGGIILFWNESRLLQFFHSILVVFFSFLLLIYSRDLLVYFVVIIGLLLVFIVSKSLVFLLYLGNSMDLKDSDFPSWLLRNKIQQEIVTIKHIGENTVAEIDSFLLRAADQETQSIKNDPQVLLNKDGHDSIENTNEPVVESQALICQCHSDHENSNNSFVDDETLSGFSDFSEDSLFDSWLLSSSNTTCETRKEDLV
jgi:hypothetical protein